MMMNAASSSIPTPTLTALQQAVNVLELIANTDALDAALDPDRAIRVASATLAAISATPPPLQAQTAVQIEQAPVYQYQMANGHWVDQAKESYDYNVKQGQAVVRVLYAAPAAQPVLLAPADASAKAVAVAVGPIGREIRPGTDDKIVKWSACPDCGGHGWLCSNTFAAFGHRYTQCLKCENTKRHYDKTGVLPFTTEVFDVTPGGSDHHGLDNDKQVLFYEQDFYVLSNFSSFSLYWQGGRFDTSEAAYHWEKFPNYPQIRSAIAGAFSAHDAFKIAEQHKADRRSDWDNVKVGIMRKILLAKAEQHEYVRRKLLATGDRELIENSWRDDFWGWGPKQDGQNMLGKLWMEVRAALTARAEGGL